MVGRPGLPSAPGCFRLGLSAHCFYICDQKTSNSRLGAAKIPQQGIDLINMAPPVWCKALNVKVSTGTTEFKGLLLLCSVLVGNGRGGVVIKEAVRLHIFSEISWFSEFFPKYFRFLQISSDLFQKIFLKISENCNLNVVTSELDSESLSTLREIIFERDSCKLLVYVTSMTSACKISESLRKSESFRKFQKV